jgi:hypothetical protein
MNNSKEKLTDRLLFSLIAEAWASPIVARARFLNALRAKHCSPSVMVVNFISRELHSRRAERKVMINKGYEHSRREAEDHPSFWGIEGCCEFWPEL